MQDEPISIADYRRDMALEAIISDAHSDLTNAKTSAEKLKAWDLMRGLINKRSPSQIKRMEKAKGLR